MPSSWPGRPGPRPCLRPSSVGQLLRGPDVDALPYGGGSIGERILRQVGQPRIYTETDSYFGPDRRDRTPADVEGQVRRIEIMRSPRTGIAVLNDDVQVVV